MRAFLLLCNNGEGLGSGGRGDAKAGYLSSKIGEIEMSKAPLGMAYKLLRVELSLCLATHVDNISRRP